MNWSEQQEAIFNWGATGRGSAVVIAVAGSGKTTTIVEMANRIPANLYCAFVAFNKAIATELATRLPKHVRAMTLNGMGFSTWMRHLGKQAKVEVSSNKTRDIMRTQLNQVQLDVYAGTLPKLVALGKSAGIVPAAALATNPRLIALTRDTDEAWFALMEHYDVDVENQLEAIDLARKILVESISLGSTVIDFDDQLYLPIIHGARFWQNDWLFVDEAQDVNKIQRAMLKRALRPTGRLVAVGDPHQAIYGFRGADTSSISNIRKEFGAVELPLTVSYRCPTAIVEHVQQFVSHIKAAPGAPKGHLAFLDKFDQFAFNPEDAILCRNTGPVVDLAFKLLRYKVGCRVLGREIGQGLVGLVKKMRVQGLDQLETRLAEYNLREQAKFIAKGEEQKADALNDRISTIMVFIENLDEKSRTIPALVAQIESLFTDNGVGLLTLCTVHKSKGLEWNRVFILDAAELMPSKWARQEWQQEQERNLQYVAGTRTKDQLYYIGSKGWKG